MKPKQLLILAIILGILVLSVWVRKSQHSRGVVQEAYQALDFEFDRDQVNEIHLGKGDNETISLIKKDSLWTVSTLWGARADHLRVARLLSALQNAKGELRGSDDALLADFDIDDEKAFTATLLDSGGQKLLDVKIGGNRPGEQTGFIRLAESNEVFLLNRDILGELGIYGNPSRQIPRAEVWGDLNFFHESEEDMDQIEVREISGKKLKTKMSIQRSAISEGDSPWEFEKAPSGQGIDQKRVKRYIKKIRNARAAKIVDPQTMVEDFKKPDWELEITLREGDPITIRRGRFDKDTRVSYLSVSNQPVIYEVSEFLFKDLNIENAYLQMEESDSSK